MFYSFYLILHLVPIILGEGLETRGFESKVRPHRHRYLVQLGIENEKSNVSCTGCIINKEWILSSAHCFTSPTNIKVRRITRRANKQLAEVDVSDVLLHPNFDIDDYWTMKYDIALLKTSELIEFDRKPVAIEMGNFFPETGSSAIIAGYREGVMEGRVRTCRCHGDTLCTVPYLEAERGVPGDPIICDGRLVGVLSQFEFSSDEDEADCSFYTFYADIHSNWEWLQETMSTHK